jgi:hypothetical protein
MSAAMKKSLAIACLAAVLLGSLGWREQHRAGELRQELAGLRKQASELGFDLSEDDGKNPGRNRPRRTRVDSDAEAGECAKNLIAFIKLMQESGDESDPAIQGPMIEVIDSLYRLDGAQVGIVLAAVGSSTEIDDEIKEGVIAVTMMILGNKDPAAAAGLLVEPQGFLKGDFLDAGMMEAIVGKWAEQDPLAALAWVRSTKAKSPDRVDDGAVSSLISGTASRNPKLAFQLLKEFDADDTHGTIYQIGTAARDNGQRDALMQTLRELDAATPAGEKDSFAEETVLPTLSAMSETLLKEGFTAASQWMDSANLSEPEKVAIVDELGYTETGEETGKWIHWMGENLTDLSDDSKISQLMNSWTRDDHRAAGSWLASANDGPARNAAVAAYARTIAPFDAAAAAKWAATISDPEARAGVIESIKAEADSPDRSDDE